MKLSTLHSSFDESTHCKYGLIDILKLQQFQKQIDWNLQWACHIEIGKYIRKLCSLTRRNMIKTAIRIHSSSIIYYRRFYAQRLITEIDPRLIAATCVFFSSKVEGCLISPHSIIEYSKQIIEFPFKIQQLTDTERILIEALKKTLIVWHPEKDYEDICNSSQLPEFVCETVQSILNDAYLTNAIITYQPTEITLGCVVVAGILQNCDIRTLLCSISINLHHVEAVANEILNYYSFINSEEYLSYQQKAKEIIHVL
ncbi:cyclin-C1-1, putative [Entamoeba dispar SAW760]|nr:cyclin-C1-1, putative [Entamoeba dispar SAW760]EDR28059.1 cyclin-C1-1, putative [Entamoeba dispar SAW760]|eukprot:EDR28059.1 cyclin-C1-1, putative [Entamoeba dispar SAW760]